MCATMNWFAFGQVVQTKCRQPCRSRRSSVYFGGLIGGLLILAASPGKKSVNRPKEIDGKPFDEVRTDHKNNFTIPFDEIIRAEVAAPSFWFRMNWSTVPHFGLVCLDRVYGGRLRLAMASPDDVKRGAELLSKGLGEKLDVRMPVAH
jgi:hypothetical protein